MAFPVKIGLLLTTVGTKQHPKVLVEWTSLSTCWHESCSLCRLWHSICGKQRRNATNKEEPKWIALPKQCNCYRFVTTIEPAHNCIKITCYRTLRLVEYVAAMAISIVELTHLIKKYFYLPLPLAPTSSYCVEWELAMAHKKAATLNW